MTEQERKELIEKMARAAWESDGFERWEKVRKNGKTLYLREARAALAVAEPVIREQCASIAENFGNDVSASKYESSFSGKCVISASLDIAAAIREGSNE